MHTGLRADRPALHDGRFAGRDRMLIELGRVEIPMNCSEIFEAELIGAVGAVPYARLFHAILRSSARPPPVSVPQAPHLGTALGLKLVGALTIAPVRDGREL